MYFNLYRDKEGIHFLSVYKPMAGRLRGVAQDETSAMIYQFKATAAGLAEFSGAIQAVRTFLDCDLAVPVPPSTTQLSSVERACGPRVFVPESARPNRHNFKNAKGFPRETERARIRVPDAAAVKGRRVLLVDDIATTGSTLAFYSDWLSELGAAQVKCFAFGRSQCGDFTKVGGICVSGAEATRDGESTAPIEDLVEHRRRILRLKVQRGESLSAADYRFLKETEKEERAAVVAPPIAEDPGDPTMGATLEEDLEEWTLRDGAVRGQERRLSALAAMHQVPRDELEKKLWKIQRGLLARYGFEGTKKSGQLSGNEALALQWVKSIAQLGQASREWELRMEEGRRARHAGKAMPSDEFADLIATLRQIVEKRDGLSLKVRELSAKEKKAGTGRGQKGHSFQIVIGDGEKG